MATLSPWLRLGLSLLLAAGFLQTAPRATAATAETPSLSAARQDQLDRYLTLLEQHQKFMGSLAISRSGNVVYSRAFGFADVATGVKTGPETAFRIGSISKVFTAVMIFQLIEAGKLSLDTPLSDFYPDLPNARQITVSQLLNHRSGLENFTSNEDYASYMTQPQSRAAMLERIRKGKPAFAPDSKASYSNSNYVLLSLILESITGQAYAEALNERIVTPLGLKRTRYGGPARLQDGDARSYSFVQAAWKPEPETDMSIPIGAGAIVSTPSDLNRFLRAVFQGQLVSKASLAQMLDLRDGYGRGLFAIPYGQQRGFGHNGGIDGFVSTSIYFPEQDLNLTLLSNGVNLAFNEVLLGVLSLYHGDPFTLPDFTTRALALAPAALQSYAGLYGSKQIPLKIELKLVGGSLQGQASGQSAFALTAYPGHEFRQDQFGLRIVFEAPGPDGKVSAFVLHQAGQSFRFERQ